MVQRISDLGAVGDGKAVNTNISNIGFESQRADERPAYLLEKCDIRKQEIYV